MFVCTYTRMCICVHGGTERQIGDAKDLGQEQAGGTEEK